MKKMMVWVTALVAVLIVAATPAQAGSNTLGYSGMLYDTLDQPVDATLEFKFRLYDRVGVQVWPTVGPLEETHGSVVVTKGQFSVQINSVDKDLAFSQIFTANTELELEITVAGQVMTPRQPLAASAWSLMPGPEGPTGPSGPAGPRGTRAPWC